MQFDPRQTDWILEFVTTLRPPMDWEQFTLIYLTVQHVIELDQFGMMMYAHAYGT